MPELMPNWQEIVFKPAFIEHYSQLTDWEAFKQYSLSFLRRSIRVNTLVATVHEVCTSLQAKGWVLTPIPWCPEGFWIEHADRRDVGNLLEYYLGKIYVQEAASMIPPLVLDPQEHEVILDMCASPGSKTTQIGAMMNNTGLLVANDYQGKRLQALGVNIQRSVLTNIVVTLMSGTSYKGLQFDRILVDAPCSGTGTIRKSIKTIQIWNPHMLSKLAAQQKLLLVNAYHNLKSGGTLVYSTCSVEPIENEGVVNFLLTQFPEARVVPCPLPCLQTTPCILEYKGERYRDDICHALRIWPQDNDTEGFFVARIQKP